MKNIIVLFILFHSFMCVFSQHEKKYLPAAKIKDDVTIDGALNEKFWADLPVADQFIMLRPDNGSLSEDSTRVKIAYDNNALYVGAIMYQRPEDIHKALTKRDVYVSNADKFGIFIAPFNDGINGYEFWVTASGIQLDFKKTGSGSDQTWDAVWQSGISMTDSGWVAEMRIPYSALRFPRMEVQNWGLNMLRVVRHKQYLSSWNFVNRAIPGIANQSGELTGLKNIRPPLRLSFTPYVSGYIEKNSGKRPIYAYKGGLDFKYGINESFTLDMMLIPDFGQVQSDDVVLNLTPYEVQYEERRQFFVEGSELFTRGNVFYSKRIGGKPHKYGDVDDQADSTENMIENPNKTQLLNATKLSGRTDKGLGIGVLNAITSNTYAVFEDSISGEKRDYLTQPLTNYNIFVLDQTLRNNSYASIINTNMYHEMRNANVTCLDFELRDKKNMYEIRGIGAISRVDEAIEKPEYGNRSYIRFAKISGNFRAKIYRSMRSNTFDINDMGFMSRNNIIYNRFNFLINDYRDYWHVIKTRYAGTIHYDQFYRIEGKKNVFTQFMIDASFYAQFRNYSDFSLFARVRPVEQEDYDETRVDGRVFKDRTYYQGRASYETDPRKQWNIEFDFSAWQTFRDKDAWGYRFNVEPGMSVGDKLNFKLDVVHSMNINNLGYVSKNDVEDTIYFGNRDIKAWETTFKTSYSFDEKSTISLRIRHYWSEVLYDRYFILRQDGYLDPFETYNDRHDKNFNVFNLDLVYTWRFAPGSEMSVVWKNAISSNKEDEFYDNYFRDFVETISEPQSNTLSVRVLYYIDYARLKRTFIKL